MDAAGSTHDTCQIPASVHANQQTRDQKPKQTAPAAATARQDALLAGLRPHGVRRAKPIRRRWLALLSPAPALTIFLPFLEGDERVGGLAPLGETRSDRLAGSGPEGRRPSTSPAREHTRTRARTHTQRRLHTRFRLGWCLYRALQGRHHRKRNVSLQVSASRRCVRSECLQADAAYVPSVCKQTLHTSQVSASRRCVRFSVGKVRTWRCTNKHHRHVPSLFARALCVCVRAFVCARSGPRLAHQRTQRRARGTEPRTHDARPRPPTRPLTADRAGTSSAGGRRDAVLAESTRTRVRPACAERSRPGPSGPGPDRPDGLHEP